MTSYTAKQGGHAKYHLADHLPIIYILIITFFWGSGQSHICSKKIILIILFGSLGYPKYTILYNSYRSQNNASANKKLLISGWVRLYLLSIIIFVCSLLEKKMLFEHLKYT